MLDVRAARDAWAPGAWTDEVIVLEAAGRPELLERIERLANRLEQDAGTPMKDLAYTINKSLEGLPVRLGIVASSTVQLGEKLRHAIRLLSDPDCSRIKDRSGIYFFSETAEERGRVAFLFPGEGSQYVGMLAGLCIQFPEARESFDRIDRAFIDHERGFVPSQFIYPPPQAAGEQRPERIWQMDGAVEAVFTANAAVTAVLDRLGVVPDAVMGHSTGDYSALVASGCIATSDEDEVIRFMLDLNRLYRDLGGRGAVPEALLVAVGTTDRNVLVSLVAAAGPDVSIAMDNCPHQAVLCGRKGAFGPLLEELRRRGAVCEELSFDRPYHTELFRPVCESLKAFYDRLPLKAPRIPVYSGATAAPLPQPIDEIAEVCVSQWARPVRFRETIEAMYADGMRIFVEAGPRGNLTAFVNDILRGRPHLAVPADVPQRSGLTQLNHLVAMLSALGVQVRFDPLYASRRPRSLELEEAKPARKSSEMKLDTGCPQVGLSEETAATLRHRVAGMVSKQEPVRQPAGSPSNGSNGARATEIPQSRSAAAASSRVTDLVSSHLQTMESFLKVQREVMEAYLSGGRSVRVAGSAPVPTGRAEARAPLPAEAPRAVESEPPAVLEQPAADQTADAPTREPAGVSREKVAEILLELVSERTGYPVEMLNLDLDLEADLGIDSIKRVEILGSLQQTLGDLGAEEMEQLSSRKTLQELIDLIGSTPVQAGSEAPATRAVPGTEGLRTSADDLPFIGSILSLGSDEVVAARELRLEEDLFLMDHALGHQVSSADRDLRGLPVVPLTMAMEMLAEVASLLAPGLKVVGMREIRAHRWMSLEKGSLRLRLTARRGASKGEVVARIAQDQEDAAPPIVEGTILFASDYPQPPVAGEFTLTGDRASRWQPDRLYTEGMFHGPSFRGVTGIDRWGENGALATMTVLPREGHYRSREASYLTDPVLLDQPGQVVGFWMAEHLDEGFVVFPFRLGALRLYAPPRSAGTILGCRARIELVGNTQVRSDLDVVGDGKLLARFEEWEDRRFYLPRDFARLLLAPGSGTLGQPLPSIVDAGTGAVEASGCLLDLTRFPDGLFEAHGGVWREVLARFVLSATERKTWSSLPGTGEERLAWLIGRAVAKDAVIRLLDTRADEPVRHADLEILEDDGGLALGGKWGAIAGGPVLVSIARNGPIATALAVLGRDRGIGIAIEKHSGEEADLSSHERGLIDGANGGIDNPDWPARLVCAKEAVARALGLPGPGTSLQAERLDPDSGRITLTVDGGNGSSGRTNDSGLVAYTTKLENGTIVATSIFHLRT